MKHRTTKRAIMNGYSNVISVGYCRLQHILDYVRPTAYTCGVYGWNADVYELDGATAIVTGYRPFGNIEPTPQLVEEFDLLAMDLITSRTLSFYEKNDRLMKLLRLFADKAIQHAKS